MSSFRHHSRVFPPHGRTKGFHLASDVAAALVDIGRGKVSRRLTLDLATKKRPPFCPDLVGVILARCETVQRMYIVRDSQVWFRKAMSTSNEALAPHRFVRTDSSVSDCSVDARRPRRCATLQAGERTPNELRRWPPRTATPPSISHDGPNVNIGIRGKFPFLHTPPPITATATRPRPHSESLGFATPYNVGFPRPACTQVPTIHTNPYTY